jgi:hypothetical protein
MRRLPPTNEPDEKTLWALIAPKALGLVIGLVLGYLLLPGASGEPEAAPTKPASASLR